MQKLKDLLFTDPIGAVDTNDWCIKALELHSYWRHTNIPIATYF